MKVIMLKDVAKIGRIGEIKQVADGFAINFLLPRKLAEKATPERIRTIESNLKGKNEAGIKQMETAAKAIDSLAGMTIKIEAKVNEKGHLYRELKAKDIAFSIKEKTGLVIPEEFIKLEDHLKQAGKTKVLVEGAGKKEYFEVEI